jgi:transcriptional regulator with XRE-family HTH domain
VITNERQYRITKAALRRLEEGLAAQDSRDPSPEVDPRIHLAMRESIASEAEQLRAQIHHYEQLRDGHITEREITSLRELPTALIEARIAARLTQRELAASIDVPEQQIQRWEAHDYAGVNLERLQNIADALGIHIHETITYKPAA